MLRRRILASAMASVMAIGSVAVVASAEDTAAATTQVKTKADLEAYVKSFDSFRNKEINDYSSATGEDFLDALEYADKVVDDTASTVDDYTVAYQMVTATYNKLKVYTAEELSALIKANKAKYDSKNVYNEDLGDAIYKNEDGKLQWDTFVTAYEDAEDVLNSKDSRIISDAYEALQSASSNLAVLDTVTKSQFRTALKTYEQLKQKFYTYDTWRRGTLPGWMDMSTGNYWYYNKGTNISFGALASYLTTGETNNGKGWYDAYNDLDSYKSVTKTSISAIVDAYKMLSDANDLLSNWTADDTNRSSKASVKSLINDYRGALVHDFAPARAEALYQAILNAKVELEVSTNDDGWQPSGNVLDPWNVDNRSYAQKDYTVNGYAVDDVTGEINHTVFKMVDASITVRSTSGAFYIPLNDDGYYDGAAITTTKPTSGKYKMVSKKSAIDLTDYIDVTGVVSSRSSYAAAASASKTTAGDTIRAQAAALPAAKTDADTKAAAVAAGTDAQTAALTAISADAAKEWKVLVAKVQADYTKNYADFSAALTAFNSATSSAKIKAAFDKLSSAWSAMQANVNYEKLFTALSKAEGVTNWWDYPDNNTHGIDWSYLDNVFGDVGTVYNTASAAFKEAYADVLADEQAVYSNTNVVNNKQNDYIDAVGEVGMANNDSWFYSYVLGTSGQVTGSVRIAGAKSVDNIEVNLADAMYLAELYLNGEKEDIADASNPIYDINTTDEIAAGSAKSSTAEWTIVYRYLKYALADKYDLGENKYTKADVIDLLEKSYDLAEKTGDAALFTKSHNYLVTLRRIASDWVAAANKDKKYKDNESTPNDYTSSQMYDLLWNAYNMLNINYSKFKYSFGEIYTNLATYAEMIDEGELEATDTLKAALEDTAYRLSIVESMNDDKDINVENDAFDGERKFLDFNRVYCGDHGDNPFTMLMDSTIVVPKPDDNATMMSHYNLRVAYEALQAEVAKQTEVKTLLGDVNGDGVVNALDASAILKAVVNNTVIDVAVGDYNADGAVNALDASAILKFVVSQA